MKICLINPPYVKKAEEYNEEDRNNSFSGYTLPHLGLGYISAYLKSAGYDVDIIECMGQNIWYEDIADIISNKFYDIIGISVYDGNRKESFRLVDLITRKSAHSFVVFGGYTATLSYESLLKIFRNIQCCCILGEGEQTFLELVKTIEQGTSLSDVKGIAYYTDGNIVRNEKRELIKDLDILPFPNRVFVSKYNDLSMIASRGCNGNCIYCSIINFYRNCKGKHYRRRSAVNVVEEMIYLKSEYKKIRTITFFDDNFLEGINGDSPFFYELYSILKEKRIRIPFAISACVRDVLCAEDILSKLKSVGLYKVFVGIESFNQRQLDFYNKNVRVEDNINALKLLKRLGLKISVGFIAFDPFVTLDEIYTNFSVLRELEIYNDSFSPFSLHTYLVAVHDTPVQKLLQENGMSRNNERGYVFKELYVEDVHFYVKKWNDLIMKMIIEEYNVEMYKGEPENTKYKRYVNLFQELVRMDIGYVLELIQNIKYNGGVSELNLVFELFACKFEELYLKLKDIR